MIETQILRVNSTICNSLLLHENHSREVLPSTLQPLVNISQKVVIFFSVYNYNFFIIDTINFYHNLLSYLILFILSYHILEEGQEDQH